MHFRGYTKQEISEIINARMPQPPEGHKPLLDVAAVDLLAANVASRSGDVRMVIDICRKAIQKVSRTYFLHLFVLIMYAVGDEIGGRSCIIPDDQYHGHELSLFWAPLRSHCGRGQIVIITLSSASGHLTIMVEDK